MTARARPSGHVHAGAIGAILMGCGLLVVVVALAASLDRSPSGMGGGVGLILAGAVCEWGLRVQPSFVDLDGPGCDSRGAAGSRYSNR